MIDVQTVDAASTIALLEVLEAVYPLMMLIHVFLDNARYHHAKLVQEWLERPGCRVKLIFYSSCRCQPSRCGDGPRLGCGRSTQVRCAADRHRSIAKHDRACRKRPSRAAPWPSCHC
jgi:hypothetical protein